MAIAANLINLLQQPQTQTRRVIHALKMRVSLVMMWLSVTQTR